MSIDLRIFSVCDHQINQEQVQIDSDLKTIRLPRVLGSKEVTLYINGFKILPKNRGNEWDLESDERSFDNQKNKIVFRRMRKSTNDFYLVTYKVLPDLCPKCSSLRVLNDTSYSNLGLANFVANEEKLLQEVKKGIMTELGSNPFHTWVGTKLKQLIGNKVYNIDAVRANMIQEISTYLDKYLDIQTQQAQYQSVTDRESYFQTLVIDALPDQDDPTIWTVTVVFQNRTGADMVFEKKLDIPLQSSASSRGFNFS